MGECARDTFPESLSAALLGNPMDCLEERRFAFGNRFCERFATKFLEKMQPWVNNHSKPDGKVCQNLTTKAMKQFHLSHSKVWSDELCDDHAIVVKAFAELCGIPKKKLAKMHVMDVKLLETEASSESVDQIPHLDSAESADKLNQVYTVLIPLTMHTTTGMPTFKAEEFSLPEFASGGRYAAVTNKPALRETVESGLLDKKKYDSWLAFPGDILLFPHSCMHFGTKNDRPEPRWVLFCLLTPFSKTGQDNYQMFGSDRSLADVVCDSVCPSLYLLNCCIGLLFVSVLF